ncbi:hypothetical protein BaRGS_00010596 [Batillaria attramentaria]|uniref:Alpha-mannosidase n=2 Tax=Batillaria attramentaria TaxID=370345 RepID=A0ABD0LG54_9CAEN
MAACLVLSFYLAIIPFSGGFTIHGKDRNGADATCGYSSCNPVKDDMVNVHLVPHTHDDVGWIMTVDQYYYRAVQYILDSVIPELVADPKKRFIYVEIAFFARWFREQNDFMRHTVKKLVNTGQLEFILGGWCMNDEASTHYNAIIDQHTLGFEFLRENFGDCGRPRVGWQIDPFGHSREMASLFARFGFDSLYFGRLDYQDKDKRQNTTTMEMIWQGSPDNLGPVSDLFTGVLQNTYFPPNGFCYDILCGDDPVVDDSRLHDVNVKAEVEKFLKVIADQAKHYSTNHVMVTMGSDFQYQAAHNWYKNLDKLIKYVNEQQVTNGSKVNLLYSTPSCYTYHVNRANKTWTTKKDDFFPYAHRAHSFWTGYFTSRPALKNYVRRTNNFLQVVKQMDALAMLEDTDNSTYNIRILSEALGVAQHHDAVSGTEKQVVAYDYAERLANGVNEGQKVVSDAFKKLLPLGTVPSPSRSFCTLLNISMCSATETNGQFQVTVYNPVGRAVQWFVRVPVEGSAYNVVGPDGKPVQSECWQIDNDTLRIPERKSSAAYDLVFPVSLPPLGYNVYFVSRRTAQRKLPTAMLPQTPVSSGDTVELQGKYVAVSFDTTTGRLKSITNMETKDEVPVTQNFFYYVGHAGNNSKADLQASGAYIFRPNSTEAYTLTMPKLTTSSYKSTDGSYVKQAHQEFSPWVSQTVRIYDDQRFVEFQWTVGPIPIDDMKGKEVISRFSTNLQTNGVFYTDANGREVLRRELNHRDTWQLNQTEPVAGNYYPVNSRIYIRDETKKQQFTVMTDRSQGGASLRDGELELMVHRRLLHDDSLGVGEPLNETGADGKGLVVRGSHYVFVGPISTAASVHRDLCERLFMAPELSFTNLATTQSDWSKNFRTTWSGMNRSLPDNIHLLTLEQFPAKGPVPTTEQPFLLRLEHFYEKGEDAKLSQPVTISLQELFTPFRIKEAKELTLGANLVLSDLKRLKWQTQDGTVTPPLKKEDHTLRFKPLKFDTKVEDTTTITLNPMEIRTFQITVAKRG